MVKEVVDGQIPEGTGPSIHIYECAVLGLLIPYCFVTTLSALSIFTLFGNVVTFATLFIILQHIFRNLQVVDNVEWYPSSPQTLPLFFGTAMYAFESIGLILPIENRMKERSAFHGWNGLLSMSMAMVVVLYCVMGFYGYLAFGIDTKMILSNLPTESWLYNVTKLMYALTIFISYNLQLYVPVQIMFPTMRRWINKEWCDKFGEYIFRTVLVIFTFALAVGVPCLELMISLIGALCSASLALIFPPICDLVCCFHEGHRHRLTCWTVCKNAVLILFGVFGACAGTFIALKEIAGALATPEGCGA